MNSFLPLLLYILPPGGGAAADPPANRPFSARFFGGTVRRRLRAVRREPASPRAGGRG